jgi:hypothetical protein
MRGLGTAEDFALVQNCAFLGEICTLHKATRALSGREDMKAAQEGGCGRVPCPDQFLVVGCQRHGFPFRDGRFSWSAGEAVKTSNVGNGTP